MTAFTMGERLKIVVFGLSLSSSWGNGHATTYRALLRGLACLGHDVLFLECDKPWYAQNRDLTNSNYARLRFYGNLREVRRNFTQVVREADLVIVGSYVVDGSQLGKWVVETARGVTAFYDIDTPITLTRLATGEDTYISRDLVPRYDLYLSFTGGPVLQHLERRYGARMARALYCSVDAELYSPKAIEPVWDLGYMGTYSDDRQPFLEQLLLDPAKSWPEGRFVVAGSQYPESIAWPANVERAAHVSPAEHPQFYAAQRFTLNVTRREMRARGYSPSVRLFEAAACGTPIISDNWPGLDYFFKTESEILIANSFRDILSYLRDIPESQRRAIAKRARERVLREHTGVKRAAELIAYHTEACANIAGSFRTDSLRKEIRREPFDRATCAGQD
jgi:spore maturation protein CgeB